MKRLIWGPMLVLLASCASPPPPGPVETDIEIAATWSVGDTVLTGAEADRLQEDWWVQIGGAALDSLVREALDANYSLAIAAANVEAARAGADIAGAPRLPQVSASYSVQQGDQYQPGFPFDPPKTTSQSVQLQAAWELDLWNKLGQLERAALADYQASEADLAGARLSIAAAVTRAWLDLVEVRAQAELAARAFDAFSETAETSWDRYQRGLIPAIDVHLTRTSRDNAGALLALRRNQVEATARRLEVLLGRYPRAELETPIVLPDAPTVPPAGLPADLLLRRPDLLAAERRLVAGQSRTSSAKRAMLPTITLTGTAGFTSDALEDILEGDFSVWSIGGSLLQPIFQGGRLRAQARQSAAFEAALVNAWANDVLTAFSEVEIALASETWLREREEKLRSASDSALAAYQLSQSRYRQGVGSLFEVLESQRGALNAEGQWISVRNERLAARVDLFLALGGGFSVDDDRPVTDFLSASDTEAQGADR
jgi:NodT family efflux transporter outer membrane factor (OMF) lipoprotein